MNALYEAVRGGDLELLERLIDEGADVNKGGEGSKSLLHEALRLGREDVARRLIAAGADVDAKIGDGYAPLRIAIAAQSRKMVEMLLTSGADANTVTRYGETPLHAVNDAALAELLIDHGADVNAKAMDGGTPLHYAAWWDRAPIARLLVEKGADLNATTIYGETPLRAAIGSALRLMPIEGHEGIRELLERHGAELGEQLPVADSTLDPRILRPFLAIHDEIVPDELAGHAWGRLNQPIWGFGLGTFEGSPYKNARTSISLTDPMVQAISRLVEPKLPYACRLVSVYANANRTGDADEVHKDCDEPGYPTALYYANLQWHSEWSGETVFYNELRNEFVRSVYPKPGRVAIFDGRIWHNVRVPSRHFGGIRVTVVFNYEHTGFAADS